MPCGEWGFSGSEMSTQQTKWWLPACAGGGSGRGRPERGVMLEQARGHPAVLLLTPRSHALHSLTILRKAVLGEGGGEVQSAARSGRRRGGRHMHRRTRRQRHHQRQPLQLLEAHSCQSRQSTGGQERRPVVKSRTDGWQGSFGRATGVHLAALCSVYPSITRRCEGGAMVRISHCHRPTWQRAMARSSCSPALPTRHWFRIG